MRLARSVLLAMASLSVGQGLRHVLVTGANKGIGRAIVKKILTDQEGTFVFLGSRDAKLGDSAKEGIVKEAPECDGRISVVPLDVTDDASVQAAAEAVQAQLGGEKLFAICNNAGIGFGNSIPDTLNTNLYGPKRVTEAFLPLLDSSGGKIVNIASASGPMFVANCPPERQALFTDFSTTWDQLKALMDEASAAPDYDGVAYGLSKACLNVYTYQLAQQYPDLRINSCTPGYINTDLTRGMGATNPPEKGTIAPLYCIFGDPPGTGRYYGSDAVRSPLDRYRGPGDPPFEGPAL